jgi:hypothetical protein
MALPSNAFVAGKSITWASGRGALEILTFSGPQMALAWRLDAISQGPKKSWFPGPNPLPLALVMDLPASKALRKTFFSVVGYSAKDFLALSATAVKNLYRCSLQR